jgi:glycosyltransferase involved in cell wall biosynthesis
LFSPTDEKALAEIPKLPAGVIPDVEYRIAFPYDLVTPPRAKRTFVFGTSEYQFVTSNYISGGVPLADAHALHDGRMIIVTMSNWSREGFIQSGADPERVVVVSAGVDTSVYYPPTSQQRSSAKAKYKFAENEFVFANIGAMTGNKNVAMILRSFASVLREHSTAKLFLKGIDSLFPSKKLFMTAALQSLSGDDAALALPRVVYVGGSLSDEEMREVYHAADCYVSPYAAEGFNIPVLEAAACGVPVICTSGGPTDDFTTDEFAWRIKSNRVCNDVNGTIAKSLLPDEDHLRRLMQKVVVDVEFRKQARVKGPSFVADNFTWRHVVDRLLAIFFSD